MAFVFKSINPSPNVGADLEELRRRGNRSRTEAAEQTKIPEFLIRALEEDRWEEIPDPLYAERIFRSYVRFLGGNERYFLDKYRKRLKEKKIKRTPAEILPRTRLRHLDLAVTSRLVGIVGFLLLTGALGAYLIYEARTINTPPPLIVDEPLDGTRLTEPVVHVHGKTMPESSVKVNGQTIVVQSDGSFEGDLDVPRGTTLLLIEARRRHGESAQIARRVLFDKPLPKINDLPETNTSSTIDSIHTTDTLSF